MHKRMIAACMAVFLLFTAANAQKAEVTVSLNEAFFDALLDSIYQKYDAPEFPIPENKTSGCNESIKILRESSGVRTAVRYREGKIYLPLAFSGNYAPPFIGALGLRVGPRLTSILNLIKTVSG